MMRPRPATWFEILAARDDLLGLVEALAAGACAEFETAGTAEQGEDARCARLRERFHALERRYRDWWPQAARPPPRAFPQAVLAEAMARIEAWVAAAEPEIAALVAAEAELAALAQWQALLAGPALGAAERAALAGGGRLAAALFVGARADVALPEGLLARPLAVAGEAGLFAVGTPAAMARLDELVGAQGGRRLAPPAGIAAPDAVAQLAGRGERCRQNAADRRQRLADLAGVHGLGDAVAEARRGSWCLDNIAAIEERRVLCRVTGWTGDATALRRALAGRALLRFPPPPPGLAPPLLLHNPWWASPYEVFSRLLGMPGGDAADPSALVALIFPLIFGYMFGDLGQGLLLTVVGLAAGRRWPLTRLFVPAGLAAAAFGLLFGSVFSRADVLAPLWLDPLHAPLPVLVLPLFGGAALLVGGLVLAAVEAHWRGQLAAWLVSEGGAVALYVGLAAALLAPAAGPLALIAVAVALALAAWQGRLAGRLSAVFAGLAGSLEQTLRLAINTISFVRVGAFAIAHAGLSSALVLLAEAAGAGGGVLLMIVGNVVIVALEVLVVSVQTTRLLLFEFFTRFFVASGRAFHPLPPAPEVRHET